jgi:hypothetical protein
MRTLTATLCLTIAVLLGSAGTSWGANFQKFLTAYKSGDFETALRGALARQRTCGQNNRLNSSNIIFAKFKS